LYLSNVFKVFYPRHFFYKKNFFVKCKTKYEYAKKTTQNKFRDALEMIFIDFGLLRSPYCEISYLLAEEH